MRELFLATFTALALAGCAGLMVEERTPITAEYIHDVPVAKSVIFAKAVEWVAKNFHSANDVIQLKDMETGKIVVHGDFQAVGSFVAPSDIPFSMEVSIKDGRYRVRFEDMRSYHSSYRATVIKSFADFDAELLAAITDNKGDDW